MMNNFHKISILFLFISSIFSACDVDNTNYVSNMHQLPTELDITDVCFVNANTGFVTAGGIFTPGLVFRTDDGGATWDTIMQSTTGYNSISYTNGLLSISQSGQRLHTTSDFLNWSISPALGWWAWHQHVRLANNRVLIVGGINFGRGYMHLKEPNVNQNLLKDTFEHEIRDIVVTPNRVIHAVGYGLILKSTDDGNSWIVSNIQGDFFRGVDFPSNDIGYVVGEYGSVYKTTNRGDSWTEVRGANSVFADPNKLLRDLAFWDENNGFLVGTNDLVYRTSDGGKTWKLVESLDGFASFSSIRIANNKAYLAGNAGQLLVIELPH